MTNETPAPEVEPGCPDCMVGLHGYPRWRRFRLPNGERCANDWHAPEVGLTEAEQLADVLYRDRQTRTVPDTVPEALDARAILASDWLAERDARIKADAIQQAEVRLAEVEEAHGTALLDLADAQDAIAQERAAWVAKIETLASCPHGPRHYYAADATCQRCEMPSWVEAALRALLSSDTTAALDTEREAGCGHTFPDGTRCRLSPETHAMPGMGHHARAADMEAGR